MLIYDPIVLKKILRVACSILKNNFFYEDEAIGSFIDNFTGEMARELNYFECFAKKEVLAELYYSEQARIHFTCYFTSANLRHVFINELHFTEQELQAFENILPKYTGEERYEAKQKSSRAND